MKTKDTRDLMIDLETLGTGANAIIISLGAVFFDLEAGELGSSFYMATDVVDQQRKGRQWTADTLKFWMTQSDAAKRVFHEQAKPTNVVLETFCKWLNSNGATVGKVVAWGNGSSFDITIMESLFQTFEIKTPWIYWNVMDLRTFKRFVANGAKVPKLEGTNHNALDDAKNQAVYAIHHYQNFKKKMALANEIDNSFDQ